MSRRAAANGPIEGGVLDILKSPDLSHEIQTLLAPLVPLGFPVSTYTTKDIYDNRITTRLFLRTVKVLFNNPDATYRNKLLSLGITHGMWVQNRNCSSRNLFDFCNWLRTKEGEAARNDIAFQLKIQRKAPNLGVAESAMVCIFKMALADMAAEVKEERVKRERQIAKISRKVAIQRAKLEKELKAVEEKYAPISEFAEPDEHVLEKECYEMYRRRRKEMGAPPLPWSDEVVEMAKIKYGSDVRNAMVADFVKQTRVKDWLKNLRKRKQTQGNSIEPVKARSKKSPRYAMGPLKLIFAIQASKAKVTCCHFSSDGNLLATGGRDKKANLWPTDNQKSKTTLEEHTDRITDVRFSPTNMSRLATSSIDRTFRIWDADNPGYSLRNFTGHSAPVMSLDFHPIKDDRICSCDDNGEIRYWSITNGSCLNVFEFQSGMTQVRFQPRLEKCLAASAENHVALFDIETNARVQALQGHSQKVQCLSWDSAGERLASVSEDLVRVWAVNNNKWLFINELNCSGSKFHSCVFHPFYPPLLIIGCYQNLELWDMEAKRTMTVPAHERLVAALAVSTANGMVGSASHDKSVKLWK